MNVPQPPNDLVIPEGDLRFPARRKLLQTAAALALLTALTGCHFRKVGPNYTAPPPVAMVPNLPFKEPLPPGFVVDGWTTGKPSDGTLKGDWWTMFNDDTLNKLEPQIDTANQTLAGAQQNFEAARFQIGFARSSQAPAIGVSPTVSITRESVYQPYFNPNNVYSQSNGRPEFDLPFDINYEVDLWGRIRRGITQAKEDAQAASADLENVRLSLHAELAMDYFGLRTADAQEAVIDDSIAVYEQAGKLVKDRYDGGVAPLSDYTQALTQLEQARVQRTDLDVQRTQYEHAIAVLIGKPPAELTIVPAPVEPALPNIPGQLPAQLLERRPDIATEERRVAAANEAIGIAEAAFYPTFSISGNGGFIGDSLINWFTYPARFYAVGPQLSQTLFDFGRRRATRDITTAQYDQTIADYRQTALTAFQQVEDNLAALRILATESAQQQAATRAAVQSRDLFQIRYEGGVDTFLQVVTYQTAALNNQRNEIVIKQRQLDASVLLIKALGGGWTTAQLPKL